MIKKEIGFSVEIYASDEELEPRDKALLEAARAVTKQAYAPYSGFLVGAAAELSNGEIVKGTNQENASYPVGICAERVLLSNAATLHPGVSINSIAISYDNTHGKSDHPVFPCGICRQSLAEYEERVHRSIRIITGGLEGEVYLIEKAGMLLPFSFNAGDLA